MKCFQQCPNPEWHMSDWSTKHLFPVSYLPPTHILPLILLWPPSFLCLHPNLKPKTVSSATALFSLEDQLNTKGFFTDLSTFNKWLFVCLFFLIQSQTSLLDIQKEKRKADEMLIWNCLLSALWGRICSSPFAETSWETLWKGKMVLHFQSTNQAGILKETGLFITSALAGFAPCKILLLVIKIFTVGNKFVIHFSYYLHTEKQNLISWGLFAEDASHKSKGCALGNVSG